MAGPVLKTTWFCALISMAAACALRLSSLSAAPGLPLIDLSGDAFRRTIVDREPGQYLGHPDTALLPDGSILAAYPKGHGKGPIVMKRSEDGGRTWSPRLSLPDNFATSQETPTLFHMAGPAGDSRLILFSGLYPIRSSISEDLGTTWTPLAPIGNFGGIVAMSSMVRLKNGAYMALFHDDGRFLRGSGLPGMFTVFKTVSADGGLSWSGPETVVSEIKTMLCEPGAIRSPDGDEIAVLLRENSRRYNSFIVFSRDEGISWSRPRELAADLTGDRHVAAYAPDGRLFITFRDMAADSPTYGDWVGWAGNYEDLVAGKGGQYRVRLMDNQDGADCGYAGLEALPDGSIIAVSYGHWTHGEAPYIMAVRFKLEELDQLAMEIKP